MARRFEGKAIFITGASSGIGAALALEFGREGGRVVLAARRRDRLNAVRDQVRSMGAEAISVKCDVTDRGSIDEAVAGAVEAFAGLDVAVANAGFGVSGRFEALTTADYRRQFDTNVFGVIDTIYAVLPHLKASRGRLGVVSSVLGRLGAPTTSAYCASKFALCGLAESLYYELGELGIDVTCINPGVVASEFRSVDNDGVYHADRKDSAPRWLCRPTDKAAREIVRAIHRGQFEAVITGHGKMMAFAARHFPRSVRFLARTLTKGRSEAIEARKRGHPPE